jgi:reductive dehalogenase
MRLKNPEIAEPSYSRDVYGTIARYDERDILFARTDLFRYFGIDSPEAQAYYSRHPEYHTYDEKIHNMYSLCNKSVVDASMFHTQFATIHKISEDRFVDGMPASGKIDIPSGRVAQKIRALALLLGADLVKTGPLKQEWVYSHVGRSFGNAEGFQPRGTPINLSHHTNAVAMAFRMEYDLVKTSPDFPTLLATAKGYAMGTWVSMQLAEYIRSLGYSARAHNFHNYQVLPVPVAVDCGLGELSRAGYLLTKEYGLAVRLAVVTTDMPLEHDKPVDIGVQSFCSRCQICADECPVRAIPHGDKTEHNGVRKWKLDAERCYSYWHAVGTDCGVCMASCPWTKPRTAFHKLMAEFAAINGPHQSLMVLGEKLFYGKYKSAKYPAYLDAGK